MKTKSTKPRGQRIFKCVPFKTENGVIHKRPFWIEPIGNNWWFNLTTGQWEQGYNSKVAMTTSYYSMEYDGYNNAYSLKAVKRLIHKWDVPKGTKFRASLPFVGYDFIITKSI